MRMWIPVFFWKDADGKDHYDVHGVVDHMVSNKEKRTAIEGDMVSCFFYDYDPLTNPAKKSVVMKWLTLEVETSPSWPIHVSMVDVRNTKPVIPPEGW